MSLYFILFGGLLYSEVFPAPDKFRFTKEPKSQSISSGQTATVLCQATGRNNDISYKWFKHKEGFTVPPDTSSLKSEEIAGQSGTSLTVNADGIDDKNMFQCQALAGSEIIYSNVGTVSITIPDSIQFDADGVSKTFTKSTDNTDPSSGTNEDVFAYIIRCNENVADIPSKITNGKPYNISWYKDSDTSRVEDTYSNMWTYYGDYKSKSNGLHIGLTDYDDSQYKYELYKFDLVIYNIRKSTDGGSYKCKAVSQGSEVILGTTQLTVTTDQSSDNYKIDTEELAVGYHVQAVDKIGIIKKLPSVGDNVILMCGAVCYQSGNNKVTYTWKDSSGSVLHTSTSGEYTVTTTAERSYTYKCSINSDCSKGGNSVSRSISFTVNKREVSSKFSFTTFSPEYIWYDTSLDTNPNDLTIDCTGGNNLVDSSTYLKYIYLNGTKLISNESYTIPKLTNNSGAYQCAFSLAAAGSNNMWVQKTTEVLIASPADASIVSPTSTSIKEGQSTTFTCVVGGYPITAVTITGPASLSLSCPEKRGDLDCTKSGDTTYELSIKSFSLSKSGIYTCRVDTKYWKDASNSVPKQAETSVEYTMPSTTSLTASINPATKGRQVTLTCIVKGYPEPSRPLLTRTDNSNSMSLSCSGGSEKTCTHEFTNIQYSDNGEYKCDGKNTIDSVEKSSTGSLSLTVNGDVDVTLSLTPDKTDFDISEKVTFTCKADGHPLPFYMKFKNTATDIKTYDGSDTSGITINTYDIVYTHIVDSLKLTDASTYTCEGKNNNGAVKIDDATKTIVVYKTVSVTLTVSNNKPDKGSSITLTCIAIGGKKPYDVELKHGSTMIAKNSDNPFCTETDSFTLKCEHTISSKDYNHNGRYTCVGKNRVQNDVSKENSASVDVEISKSVSVLIAPSSLQEVNYGSLFTIRCTVDGGLAPHKVTISKPDNTVLTWLRSDSTNGGLTCIGENIVTCTYQNNFEYSDEGTFTCTGYNKLPGSNDEKTAIKTANIAIIKDITVTITKNPSTTEVDFGKTLKITCEVEGGRAPYYLRMTHTDPANTETELIVYNTEESKTPAGVNVGDHKLTYTHSISSTDYNDNGNYVCLGKHRAGGNAIRTDTKTLNVIIVKDVEIKAVSNLENDFGTSVTIKFYVEGGRSPNFVQLSHPNHQNLINWQVGNSACTGKYNLECTKVINSLDYSYDGLYTITATNQARSAVKSSTKFTITVYKDVSATITPSSSKNITYKQPTIITCRVNGGSKPSKVELSFPKLGPITWKRDRTGTGLTCSGEHEVTCTYQLIPEYDSDGIYKCKGQNTVRYDLEKTDESFPVTLTTIRNTEIANISAAKTDVLTIESIKITCIIVGKPLIKESEVVWLHKTIEDLNRFTKTSKTGNDEFTLQSIFNSGALELNPGYSGDFTCLAGGKRKSININIAETTYLEYPIITYDTMGQSVNKDSDVIIYCEVEGFPSKRATLTVTQNDETVTTIEVDTKDATQKKQKLKFTHRAGCMDMAYVCFVKTINSDGEELDSRVRQINAPVIEGCSGMLPIIAGGVGGGFVLIIIVVVVVVFLMLRARRAGKKSTGGNGVAFKNDAYTGSSPVSPDPAYDNIGNLRSISKTESSKDGYSHLNKSDGQGVEEGYASLGDTRLLVPVVGNDGYATMDTRSNIKPIVKEDETYAKLNQISVGKERGVIRRYKPIAIPNKPKGKSSKSDDTTSKAAADKNSEGDAVYSQLDKRDKNLRQVVELPDKKSSDLQRDPPVEPLYAQVDPKTRSEKVKYPDLSEEMGAPPPVPLYGTFGKVEEEEPLYSDVRITAGEPEEPLYAQVNEHTRKKKINKQQTEDVPPEVPEYMSTADLQEESPYASVEFKPKNRTIPRKKPQLKDTSSAAEYATITDIRENP